MDLPLGDPLVIEAHKFITRALERDYERNLCKIYTFLLKLYKIYGQEMTIALFQYMLNGKSIMDLKSKSGDTLLHKAIYISRSKPYLSVEIMKILLSSGNQVKELILATNACGDNVLHLMAESTKADDFEKERLDLIVNTTGLDITTLLTAKNTYGQTPLIKAQKYKQRGTAGWFEDLENKHLGTCNPNLHTFCSYYDCNRIAMTESGKYCIIHRSYG